MQIPKDLIEEALRSLSSVANESDFFKVRSQFLGKKSFIQLSFKELKNLDPEKKVLAAKELNLLTTLAGRLVFSELVCCNASAA